MQTSFVNGRNITTFDKPIKNEFFMKSSELHRLILKNGWKHIRTTGSHYIYEKDGRRYPVPYHGSHEVGKGIEKKIRREMGLK